MLQTTLNRINYHACSDDLISLHKVCKTLGTTVVLRDLDLAIPRGQSVAIVGLSGSGKSTLVNIMSGLTPIDSGSHFFDGEDVSRAKHNNGIARKIRRESGYISQSSDMILNFSAGENIELAGWARGRKVSRPAIIDALKDMVLPGFKDRLPVQMSGGQRQRVNIARGLACDPKAIFADEPTGALDVHTGRAVVDRLVDASRTRGITLVLVTHSPEFATLCQRQVVLHRGCILHETFTSDQDVISDLINRCAEDQNP